MTPATRHVAPLLARGYVGFVEAPAGNGSWLAVPTPTATMILNLGAAFGGYHDGFVAGLDDTHCLVERVGGMSCIDVKLTPLGAYRVLGLPMDEVTGQAVDVGDVLGPAVLEVVDRIRAAATWQERYALVDAFLLRRATTGPRPSPGIAWAWQKLMVSRGQVAVNELARDIGWSRKHLTNTFRRQVGLPPSRLARIVRFDALVRRLRRREGLSFGQLAVECGYYDQAHLNRDVRDFTGRTPTEFVERHLADLRNQVPSVQDTSRAST